MTIRTRTLAQRLAMAVVLLVGVGTLAYAQQDYLQPVGTQDDCDARVTANFTGILAGTISVNGPATFEWVAVSQPGAPIAWAELRPRAVSHDGTSPQLGNVSLHLEPGTIGNSRIEANQPGATLPATSRLRFRGRVTVASQPGRVFVSDGDIVIGTNNLTVWPHNNTQYVQIGTTDFEDVNVPGVVAFTLSGAVVTVTASPDN